jgi:spore coat polysaccharide biosynthesis protein SpsF
MNGGRVDINAGCNPIAIVQARMGSTRLPGKIMKPLAGKPVLWHVVDRLSHSHYLKGIVVATSVSPEDDVVAAFCKEQKIQYFRGSEHDVLDRYYRAAAGFRADPVVRITADCPVIDPDIVDEIIRGFFDGGYDVYGHGGEFPDGLDCEMFSYRVLEDTWENADLPSEREHVGPYMRKHPEKYKIGAYEKFRGLAHHRWTLDEESDLRFLEKIYDRLYSEGTIFSTSDILSLLKAEPEIAEVNSGITRNEGYLKSLKEDKQYVRVKQT